MPRKFNFGAGPATMPESVLLEVQEELLNWNGLGLSVMEISHRSPEFIEIAKQAETDFRDLLSIKDDYAVLFTHGGATMQNAAVPLNLASKDGIADYVNSGHWAKRSMKEAERYTNINVAASSEDNNFNYFPEQNSWTVSEDSSYIHYTPNETIGGLCLRTIEYSNVPIVADYSSGILSEPIDIDKFSLIYGGAQKNIGPSGLGFVIVKKDLLGNAQSITPNLLNYTLIHEGESMSNTPPTFAWYVAGKVFKWLKSHGGVEEIGKINNRKAKKLYKFIDDSNFYENNINKENRSIMNIPFLLRNDDLDTKFLSESKNAGLLALKGHRSVGGMRASIYNGLPEEAVDTLIEFMDDFEKKNS
ncbi:3-phosphoserine/phosphohydroxythreonine transaminase [Gammaproteobacteria bacterium]|nr:3-phosphoserine/phosphohydroxythreonine transaminase [Gammaproteobacteria bacterium]